MIDGADKQAIHENSPLIHVFAVKTNDGGVSRACMYGNLPNKQREALMS
jgi:hypothetical protein